LQSDHYSEVLSTPNLSNTPQWSKEDNFKEENIQEFLYLQSQVTWQEVYIKSGVNAKHNTLLNICHYYNKAYLGGFKFPSNISLPKDSSLYLLN
jgi:hypothetical protein